MYMLVTVRGIGAWFSSQQGLAAEYGVLVKAGKASNWPSILSTPFMVIGVIALFIAILLSPAH